jgi:hypothetical protein
MVASGESLRRSPLRTRIVIAVATAGAVAAPASAEAASIAVQAPCIVSDQPVTVVGSGFTPNTLITLDGDASGSATSDANGAFSAPIPAPAVTTIAPKTVTVNASDPANPANTATVSFQVVKGAYVSNVPINGRPAEKTTWRFAGFQSGAPVYGHFRLNGTTRRNYRFGTAKGPCGTLVVQAPRVPVRKVLAGKWTLQLDQRPTYASASPHRTFRFQIYRTNQY